MRALAVLVAMLAPASALAQSARYPAKPVDSDAMEEARSVLWEQTLHPGEREYEALVANARELAHGADEDAADARHAIEELDRAIALAPDRFDAWELRGELHAFLARTAEAAGSDAHPAWTACADDLAAAEARVDAHPSAPALAGAARAKELAACQGHAGRYAAAEATLVRALAEATDQPELLVRLGAIRIAMGKLREAIVTLDAALEAQDDGGDTSILARWLLALAYDRERRPSEAGELVDQATGMDRGLVRIESSNDVLVGPGDKEYLFGLAYEHTAAAARALLYFRYFQHLVPDSPWSKRAGEHVHELAATDLPQAVERRGGYAPLDVVAARALVHRAMPAMRACLAKEPGTLLEVVVTRVGPRTSATAYDHPHYHLPDAGAKVHIMLELGDGGAGLLPAAEACVQKIAGQLPLPAPTERDAYYQAAFPVVGP